MQISRKIVGAGLFACAILFALMLFAMLLVGAACCARLAQCSLLTPRGTSCSARGKMMRG